MFERQNNKKTAAKQCLCLLVSFVLAASLMPVLPTSAYAQSQPAKASMQLTTQVAVWDGTADTSWYDSTETSYELATPAQLAGLAAIVNGTAEGIAQSDFANKTVRLESDILLNAYPATGTDANQRCWTPIGTRLATGTHSAGSGVQPVFGDPNYFKGTFEGCGHTISNIYIENVTYPDAGNPSVSDYGGYQGLFGALGEGAVVKNVGLSGGYIVGRVAGGIAALGAPAGIETIPMILNCYNTATIVGDGSSSRGSAGIFGGEYGSEGDNGVCYIANCYNAGVVQGKGRNASASLGGIAGCGIVSLYSCYNTGAVATSVSGYRGGIAGFAAKGSIVVDCYGLAEANSVLYYDATGDAVSDCIKDASGIAALVSDDLLSAAFVESAASDPVLFWEIDSAEAFDLTGKATIADIPAQAYTGSAITPDLAVTYGGRTLRAGSDYIACYSNNINATAPKSPAVVTVVFIGAYSGTAETSFVIGTASLDDTIVTGLGAQWIYENEPVEPPITVTDASGRVLVKGTDYVVEFQDNDRPGTATALIRPAQDSSYIGSKTVSFTIVAASESLPGSGTEDDPYIIASRADMQYFAHKVNTLPSDTQAEADILEGVYRLAADIALVGDNDEPDVDLIGVSEWSDEEGYRTKAFAGTFDGDGHAITMDFDLRGGYFGLFPTNVEGTCTVVRNLELAGSINTTATAATLFPNVYGSVELVDVHTSVNINAGYHAYGLIGSIWPRSNDVLLQGCSNAGSIVAGTEASGLVGELYADSLPAYTFVVKDCVNSGTVLAGNGGTGTKASYAAGVLAKLTQFQSSVESVRIVDTANTGSVSADAAAGGFIARLGSADFTGLRAESGSRQVIEGSFNAGSVTAGSIAGGLVGAVYDNNTLALSNVYATGSVTALVDTGVAGGLVGGSQTGRAWYVNISSAYSTGAVSGLPGKTGAVMGFAGCGSYYRPAGGELSCANVFYCDGGTPAVGMLEPEQVSTYVTYPAARFSGDEPVSATAAEFTAVGEAGMAARIGSQFTDDFAEINQGMPILYWQADAIDKIDIASAEVGLIPDEEYTGERINPSVDVVLDDKSLRQGSDYAVEIEGNAIDVRADIDVTITGIGRYTGTITGKTFSIVKADIARFGIDAIGEQWAGINDPAYPMPTLRNRAGKEIGLRSGFEISYGNNLGQASEGWLNITADADNPSYTGSLSAPFVVRMLPDDLAGEGTQDDPYRIDNVGDLELFAKRVNAQKDGYAWSCAQLTADVSIPSDVQMDPIGNSTSAYTGAAPYSGTFDGAGHTITLNFTEPTTYAVFNGLQGATVKNLAIAGETVVAQEEGPRLRSGGTFAGVLDARVLFSNCVNKARVTGAAAGVGGFAAMIDDAGIPTEDYGVGIANIIFKDCVNEGNIVGSPSGGGVNYVGGFIGHAYTMGFGGEIELTFDNCANRGSVSTVAGSSAGGLIGGATYDYDTDSEDAFRIYMSSVSNSASIHAFDGAGGLIGVVTDVDRLEILNAYNTGDVLISNPDSDAGQIAGGLVAVASTNSYRANPVLSIENAYNAGSVSCSADADDPLIGGILGGLSYDSKYVTLRNVFYSLDKTNSAIGLDLEDGGWEDVINPEYDETMKSASFVDELGDAFAPDEGANGGFPMLAAGKTDLSGYAVSFYDAKNKLGVTQLEVPYTGLAATPSVVVRAEMSLASPALTAGRDYVVFYADNTDAGIATVTVRGVGAYRGSVTATFSIIGTGQLESCKIAPISNQVWTGMAIEPDLAVTCRMGNSLVVLEEGKDYTVSFANNVDEGTAGVLLTGVGAWSGTKLATFKIWRPFITVMVKNGNGNASVAKYYTREQFEALATDIEPVSALYCGGGTSEWRVSTAKSYVTFAALFADAGVPWDQGSTVSYAAGDDAQKASAYSYTDLNERFFYPKADADAVDTSAEHWMVPPVLALEECSCSIGTDGSRTAKEAEAYNVAHATDGNAPRVITGVTEQEAAEKTARGMRLIKNLDTIVVTVVDYAELQETVDQTQKALKDAVVSSRNGADVAKTALWMTTTAKDELGTALAEAAKVLGNKDATQAQLNQALAALNEVRDSCAPQAGQGLLSCATIAAIGKQTYTGKAKRPAPVVTMGSTVLKQGADYTVSYTKNTMPGTATVTVAGKGAYTGTTSKTFKIVRAANPLMAKGKKVAIANAKRARTISGNKVFTVKKAKGKVTYKKKKGNAKISIKKNGTVAIKAGLKAGIYKVKVLVRTAGTACYKPAKKVVTIRVRVRA